MQHNSKAPYEQSEYILSKQFEHLRDHFPMFYDCIDMEKVSMAAHSAFLHGIMDVIDFETTQQGGRGESYTTAQRNSAVRLEGIRQLFTLASPGHSLENLSGGYKILDALGGDGTLTRTLSKLLPVSFMPSILISDISEYMVYEAQKQGLAAIRQPVQSLLLKDNSMDAVLIAYGSHHIPLNQRQATCLEAFRVLKPGGSIVFHDFEDNSPVASWFREVVHLYSLTGHDYPHYSSREMQQYLYSAGFSKIRIQYLYDPFILSGKSPQEVQYLLGNYLLNMYGLVKLADTYPNQDENIVAYTLACNYFQYDYQSQMLDSSFGVSQIHISKRDENWQIEMPRVALVATATKAL
ncbi:MAG: class I SAM-dependent methyltransferase [Ktedonobacteraceae bacterium]